MPDAENLAAARELKPRVSHVHVSYYVSCEQRDLNDGRALWPQVFRTLGGQRYALLEFVKDASQEQLRSDAQTLKAWLGET